MIGEGLACSSETQKTLCV